MSPIITLTTDFGLDDAYVAAMKGVMLTINSEAAFVDICHTIKPQHIAQGAFVLSTAYSFFPDRTVHLVVIDPGVGTERRAIILRTPRFDFVAPDNGVLSYVIQQSSTRPLKVKNNQVELEEGLQAVAIIRQEFWRNPVSPTFHGRDIFAPVAARLSLGMSPSEFGEVITSLAFLPVSEPQWTGKNTLAGRVLHVDSFGNLISNIRNKHLLNKSKLIIEVGGAKITGLSRTYAEKEGLLALPGSSGYLEIALKNGSAANTVGIGVDDEIKIRTGREK